MAEIRALPRAGLSVVSTFSGCGGSCLGFEWAGFDVLWANEFIPEARAVYAANHAGVVLDARDIRQVKGREVLKAIGKKKGDVDVMEGSPPCSSFSMSGDREADWGKAKKYSSTVQRTDDLFFEYARLVGEIRPRVFVAENVAGLVRGKAVGYFQMIVRALEGEGYVVKARVLDAAWLGVPQSRKRVIFVGVRKDVKRAPAFPKPLAYSYAIRDAIPELARSDVRGGWGMPHGSKHLPISVGRPSPAILATAPHMVYVHEHGGDTRGPSLEGYALGREWDRLKIGEKSSRYQNLVRPRADRPSPTVTAQAGTNPGTAGVTHPTERRKFSIAELKRLCGFPDDFVLTGSYAQQWERLGRAVPPPMMFAVASTIRREVFKR